MRTGEEPDPPIGFSFPFLALFSGGTRVEAGTFDGALRHYCRRSQDNEFTQYSIENIPFRPFDAIVVEGRMHLYEGAFHSGFILERWDENTFLIVCW